MSNELVPTKDAIGVLTTMAQHAHKSKLYDKLGGESGILSIMLLARELDISPMQALSGGIWNIQGKVEISARMMNMKIRQAGHRLDIKRLEPDGCQITGTRKDTGETFTASFMQADAVRAGVLNKDVWKKFPREMFFARALSLLARMLFPDVIGNCYVEGELSDGAPSIDPQPLAAKPTETETTIVEVSRAITMEQAEEIRHILGGNRKIGFTLLEVHGVSKITELPFDKFEEIKQYCVDQVMDAEIANAAKNVEASE